MAEELIPTRIEQFGMMPVIDMGLRETQSRRTDRD